MKKKIIISCLVLLSLVASAMSFSRRVAADDELTVVTTFYPVYAFTKAVVGDEGQVKLLIKAGTEPHDFEPSTKDMATIQSASAFVYLSDDMENWVSDVKKSLDNSDLPVIEATSGMTLLEASGEDEHDHHHEDGDEEDEHHHAHDPHVWLSPKRAIQLIETIRDNLIAEFPDKKAAFQRNSAAYIAKLKALDKDYQEQFASAKTKRFVTQHAAFTYLAHDYGLTQIAITGINAGTEPSAKHLADLIDDIKDYKVKYIYVGENVSPKLAETLAEETGTGLLTLNPLESLTKDEEKSGQDYISIMRDNLKALAKTVY